MGFVVMMNSAGVLIATLFILCQKTKPVMVIARQRYPINTGTALHDKMVQHWTLREQSALDVTRRVLDRYEQVEENSKRRKRNDGDEIVARMTDIFMHGLGVKWSDDQIRVFKAFQATCLPLIYGDTWNEEKTRVMRDWDMKKEIMYALVNMARRNGKTFSVSGAVAALALAMKVKFAIFSTCKRTSQLMLEAILDHIDRAFAKGTHVSEQDFLVVTRNSECVVYQGPDGTKRIIGSFPGSVRVSTLFLICCCCVAKKLLG